MSINLDRTKLFKYLRLFLLVAILICYFKPTAKLFEDFNKVIIPLAKNYFQFVQPAAITGESDICDFTTFYASGLLNRERLTKYSEIDVYDPVLITQTVERLIAPMRASEVYCIQYPPILFALTTPLTYFDLYTAWLIWSFASAICIIVTFLCVVDKVLKERPLLLIGLLIYFANAPAADNFSFGQTSAFEAAIIAVSLRLLMNKKYLWAGFVAGLSFLKFQQAMIILIPGICLGRSKFFYGCLFMVIIEGIISSFLVGPSNMLNFIKANYLCEITHSYVGLNETWTMSNFRALLYSLPISPTRTNIIAVSAYIFCCIISAWLWTKLYPVLQKSSGQVFELIASITTILLVYFSMHGYLYDFILLGIPALWLYIWSTTNDTDYTLPQAMIRLFIALTAFTLPFLFWTNLDLVLSEITYTGYQLRFFFGMIIFLLAALAALIIKFKQVKRAGVN